MVNSGTAISTRPPHTWLRRLARLAVTALVAVFCLYFVAGTIYRHRAARNLPVGEHVDEVRYLDQGWGVDQRSPQRELFYYTGQGTNMHGVRYRWFVSLEQPFSKTRLADPDHMRSLDFVVAPVPTPANPDQLPVGFAKRYDTAIHDNVVDITCAACHTGQLNVTRNHRTTAIRIDGGEAMSAFTDVNAGSFQVGLGLSVAETLVNPLKFNRFAGRVLAPGANTISGKWTLWRSLAGVGLNLVKVFRGSSAPHLYPVQGGYGRTDALTRIGNVVFGDHLSPSNYHAGNAPVSYPYLWNIWKFDWVQYNASVSQPMARNMTEAMGVGADFNLIDAHGNPIPPGERYRTSVQFQNLARIESTLQQMRPPRWPEDLLGPIDQASAARGKMLFQSLCVKCHGPHPASPAFRAYTSPGRLPTDPLWEIWPVSIQQVGTDPTAANNFSQYRVDITRTGLTREAIDPLLKQQYEVQKTRYAALVPALEQQIAQAKKAGSAPATLSGLARELQQAQVVPVSDASVAQKLNSLDFRSLNAGEALSILGLVIRDRYYTDNHFSPQAQACFGGFDTLDIPQVVGAYKPRPLEGVWATPPFLHNGSVPNLYAMFSPVKERPTRFFIGRREFDPVKVGYVTEPVAGSTSGFWMDTTLTGNRNIGHEFGPGYLPYDPAHPAAKSSPGIVGPPLTPAQRMDLIEYLKIHRDDAEQQGRVPVNCFALLP
jgi:cytochrome c5